MDSLNLDQFVDFKIYDKNATEIYLDALAHLQLLLPEFQPREGMTELLLLQAIALEISELAFVINRLPPGIMEVLLGIFQVTRDAGAVPVATAKFTMIGENGYVIPAGTLLRLNLSGGLPPVYFTTDVELNILLGDTEGTVPITGGSFTSNANDIADGTPLVLMDSILYVNNVELDSDITSGRDSETSTDLLERGAIRLTRLTDTLVLPRHFEAFALEQPNVTKAFGLDNYDPEEDPGDNGPVGDDPGHVTVAVFGDGINLTSDERAALVALIEPSCLVNIIVHVVNPTMNTQDVTVTVKKKSKYTSAEVEDAVVEEIEKYLSPENWDFSGTIPRLELAAVISNATGVDYVVTLTTPATDITLDGVAPLVEAGTVSVLVE